MSLGKKIVTPFLVLGIIFSLGCFMVLKLMVSPEFQVYENELTEGSISSELKLAGEDQADPNGHYVVHDIHGKTVASINVSAPGQFLVVGTDVIRTVMLWIVFLSIVFLVVSLLLARQLIVDPLHTIKDKIHDIRNTGAIRFEFEEGRTDVIGLLTREISAMMVELGAGKQRLEQACDEALDASRAKSAFIAQMSHEIRTPVSGVLGMIEILRNTPLSTEQQKLTDTLCDSAQSSLQVINNIQDFSNLEAGKLNLEFVDVQLNALVEEVVETHAGHAHSQKTRLMIAMPRDSHYQVRTDPIRMKQVLNILISNAIKFTREGEVVIKLTAQTPQNGKQRIFFEVCGSGTGNAHDKEEVESEQITQMDESTANIYSGSGLGLAICRQIIGQMGGELKAGSTPHEGSVFSFSFDLEGRHDTESQAARQMESVDGKNILIVDESSTSRAILGQLLGSWGAVVSSAKSVDDAYEKLASAMSKGSPYELVIIDLDMPGDNGFKLIRNIHGNPRFELLKILVLSSPATPAREKIFTRFGVVGELCKPVLQSQLYYSLAAIMRHQLLERPSALNGEVALPKLTGRVLVVEDNEVNRQVAMSMLQLFGLSVEHAANGQKAVEKYAAEPFDLILMDCQLPVMDGWKATEMIRLKELESKSRRTPVVAVTGYALKSDRERCLLAGMDDCLIKPFTCAQLHKVMSLYLLPESEAAQSFGHQSRPVGGGSGNETADHDRAIDETILKRLSHLQQPGSPSIVRKLLSLYLQSSVVIKDRLGNAIESSDGVVVRESAHALKSSSLNVGATGLAEFCKRLERMARSGDIKDNASLRESLETEYSRVVNAVESELGVTRA